MLDKTMVSAWLQAYVRAWKTYDPEAIGNLFSENAIYLYSPFHKPVRGRAAIVASWLEHRDTSRTYDAHYDPVMIDGKRAMSRGSSFYFEADSVTVKSVWSNIFLLSFDDDGHCSEYCEWYVMRKIKQS